MKELSDSMIELRIRVDRRSLPVDAVTALESLARSLYIRFGASVRGTSIIYPRQDDQVTVSPNDSEDLDDYLHSLTVPLRKELAQSLEESAEVTVLNRHAMHELFGDELRNSQTP